METNIVGFILFISLLLIAGQVFSATFNKTRIPDALLLMFIGIVIGPVLKLVDVSYFGKLDKIFTELVLIIIMFRAGTSLRFSLLRDYFAQGLRFTVCAAALVLLSTYFISHYLLGFPPVYSAILGIIISDNSLVVVAPLLAKLGVSQKMKTILVIEGSVSTIINVVLVFALLKMTRNGSFSTAYIFGKVLYSFIIACAAGAAAGVFWSLVLNKIRSLENANSLSFAFILLVYGLCGMLNSEGAIGVLIFGLVIGNMRALSKIYGNKIPLETQSFKEEEKTFFVEIEYILKTLFFVYIGISINFSHLYFILFGLLFAVIKLISRIPAANFILSKEIDKTDTCVALAMCPSGLVSAVLAANAAQSLPEGSGMKEIAYSLVFFSIIVCSILTFLIEKGRFKNIADKVFARHKERTTQNASMPASNKTPETAVQ